MRHYLKNGAILAAVVVIGLSVTACNSPYQLTQAEKNTAEIGARQYAERLGGNYISCSGQDSDGDKYVTCGVMDKAQKQVPLLCSFANGSTGCKLK